MLKRFFLTIVASMGIAAAAVAPAQAMSISSAARSISASFPIRNVELTEPPVSIPFNGLRYGNACRASAARAGELPGMVAFLADLPLSRVQMLD